jgi:VIT family
MLRVSSVQQLRQRRCRRSPRVCAQGYDDARCRAEVNVSPEASIMRHRERHRTGRIGWPRAAVLGANDGILSTASLVVDAAAGGALRHDVLLAGVASVVAGALSMAAGEYVSVSSRAEGTGPWFGILRGVCGGCPRRSRPGTRHRQPLSHPRCADQALKEIRSGFPDPEPLCLSSDGFHALERSTTLECPPGHPDQRRGTSRTTSVRDR